MQEGSKSPKSPFQSRQYSLEIIKGVSSSSCRMLCGRPLTFRASKDSAGREMTTGLLPGAARGMVLGSGTQGGEQARKRFPVILETLRVSGRVIASGVEQGTSSTQPGAHRACAPHPAPPPRRTPARVFLRIGVDSLEGAGGVRLLWWGGLWTSADSGWKGTWNGSLLRSLR